MNARMKPKPSEPLRGRVPALSGSDADRLRRLASGRRRFALTHAPNGAYVEIGGARAEPLPWVVLGAGDAHLAAALSDDRDDASGEMHWSDFEGDSRLVAWSLAHERALAWLGDVVGTRLLPLAFSDDAPADAGVSIGVNLGDEAGIACSGAVRLPVEALDRLLADERAQVVAAPAEPRSSSRIPAPVAVWLDGPAFTAAELAGLRMGDVIVAGPRSSAIENVRIDDGARAWRARWGERNLQVIGANAVTDRLQRRESMNAASNADTPGSAPAHGIAEIPVRVEFVVGEIAVPLGELERIEPGYVFELGRAIDGASVDIHANGLRIGRGQIVAIGDTLGVRITECGADGLQ